MYPKTNEWNLLKQQFDALADEESPDADSLEEIFDMEFRRRFRRIDKPDPRTIDAEPGHRFPPIS